MENGVERAPRYVSRRGLGIRNAPSLVSWTVSRSRKHVRELTSFRSGCPETESSSIMKRDFETANEGATRPHKVLTGRVSLSEVVRAVHEQEASAETGSSESLSARYLGMKSKRANVKTMFSTLFREVDGLQFLKNSLEKVLDATTSASGNTPLSDAFGSARSASTVRDRGTTERPFKLFFDQQRLSKRITSRLRSRQHGMQVELDAVRLCGNAVRQRLRRFLTQLITTANIRCVHADTSGPELREIRLKHRIREINAKLLQKTSVRQEQEHQRLLQLGDPSSKRARRAGEDDFDEDLLIRAEKAREAEEERQLANAANEATRSALGDAKYLKWFTRQTKDVATQDSTNSKSNRDARIENTEKNVKLQRITNVESLDVKTSFQANECTISLVDIIKVLKSEQIFTTIFPKLLAKDSVALFEARTTTD